MFGSIIPTPLATPTMRALADGRRGDLRNRVGRHDARGDGVGVRRRATATERRQGRRERDPSGTAGRSRRWKRSARRSASQPIVEATPATTSRALARPSSPVATLAFLEITTTACAVGVARCSRLTITLGPEKLLVVNTPTDGHGESVATTTKSLVASLMPTLATYAWKPPGSRRCRLAHSGHAVRLVRTISKMSPTART